MPNRASGLDWDAEGEGAAGRRGGRRSGPGATLTRQAIVDAAIRIADADGLAAVTIRRVAAELGARPMSLYTHIATKADLLALMINEFMGLMLVDELHADWREAVSQIARRMHAAFFAHQWALDAFTRRPQLGPNAAHQAKQYSAAMTGLGLTQDDVWTALGVVNDYVIGYALRIPTIEAAPDIEEALSAHDLSEFPELKVLATSVERRASSERFEVGLQTVLDGIERRFLTGPARRRRRGHTRRSDASPGAR